MLLLEELFAWPLRRSPGPRPQPVSVQPLPVRSVGKPPTSRPCCGRDLRLPPVLLGVSCQCPNPPPDPSEPSDPQHRLPSAQPPISQHLRERGAVHSGPKHRGPGPSPSTPPACPAELSSWWGSPPPRDPSWGASSLRCLHHFLCEAAAPVKGPGPAAAPASLAKGSCTFLISSPGDQAREVALALRGGGCLSWQVPAGPRDPRWKAQEHVEIQVMKAPQ